MPVALMEGLRDSNSDRALDIAYKELRAISRVGGFKKSVGKVLSAIRALVPDIDERTGPHTWRLDL